tara:strand:- start:5252 stop:5809 length:558 start_codon:yes stop_codon:yes gene_type:complete
MAYPKITVNTGLALPVIAADSIPIPYPGCPQLTGNNTANSANELVDVGADFSNVVIGDIVYNTATGTIATVTALNSSTIIKLSADIFQNSPNDTYIVFQGGPIFEQRIESSSGCLLYIGSTATISGVADEYVDVCVDTVTGSVQSPNTVTFKNFKVGNYLPVQVKKLRVNGSSASILNQVCIAIW